MKKIQRIASIALAVIASLYVSCPVYAQEKRPNIVLVFSPTFAVRHRNRHF